MLVARTYLSTQPKTLTSEETIRAALEKRAGPAEVPRSLARSCEVTSEDIGGRLVTTLTPKRGGTGVELVYLHGGAFVNAIVGAHWSIVRSLIKQTGATVTVPDYGLAPEHTVAEAYAFLAPILASVTARSDGRGTYVAGDSAGGALALGLAIHARDTVAAAPTGLFLFSPWLDVSMSNRAADTLVDADPMLDIDGLAWCGVQWAGDLSAKDPLVSPIFDDLHDLPPTYVYQGSYDIFLADVMKLAEKAPMAGMPLEVQLCPTGFHVFVGATFTPEAKDVFRHVGRVVKGAASS